MIRRKLNRASAVVAMMTAALGMLFVQRLSGAPRAVALPSPAVDVQSTAAKAETAIFAGGCFWGIQAVFQHTKGVTSAISGYAGGWTDKPGYEMVSTGTTGHAESVRVTYDPAKISYGQLLKIFFSVAHDPTQLNRQGPDGGTPYRSSVFYTTPDQKKTVEAYIDQLNKAHVFGQPIVTQVVAYKAFFPAEAYHQDYAETHPNEPYILVNDAPKVVNLKKQFPELYRDEIH
jgi:peptide-methionine (S)-S-oxide reductase